MIAKKSEKLFDVVNAVLLSLIGIFTFYPFYFILIYSLSDPQKAITGVYLLPAGFSFINFIQIFSENNILYASFISVSRTVIGTAASLLCCSMFSFGITKSILPFRRLMYRGIVIMMYLSVGLIPTYITIQKLHLRNNFLVYILPYLVVPFYIILIKTYFEQIPQSLEESAKIDGASYPTTFFRIILPLSKPILATVAIFQAVRIWNTFSDNLWYCTTPKLLTLQLLLYNFLAQQNVEVSNMVREGNQGGASLITPMSIRMTITVIATAPILMVYPFFQRYFLKGIMLGAVKG